MTFQHDVADERESAVSRTASPVTRIAMAVALLATVLGSATAANAQAVTKRPLLFVRDGNVQVATSTGAKALRLTTTGGRDPRWSPDGSHITYERPGLGVWVMTSTGADQRRIVSASPDVDLQSGASWSSDGRLAVKARYAIDVNCFGPVLVVGRLDGAVLTDIDLDHDYHMEGCNDTNSARYEGETDWQPGTEHVLPTILGGWSAGQRKWLPGEPSRADLLSADCDFYEVGAPEDYADDCGAQRWLAYTDYDAVYSPDGRHIAFVSDDDVLPGATPGRLGLYVMPSTGGAPRRIATPGEATEPAWVTGTRLTYTDATPEGDVSVCNATLRKGTWSVGGVLMTNATELDWR